VGAGPFFLSSGLQPGNEAGSFPSHFIFFAASSSYAEKEWMKMKKKTKTPAPATFTHAI
jgi:hypothetical protein